MILSTAGLLMIAIALLMFTSCSRTADGNITKDQKEIQNKNLEESSIDQKDFTESDEDLTNVNYKEFYDQLTAHGEWVQVKPEEIGLQPKTASSTSTNNNFSISSLFGINNAYAASDMNSEMNVEMVYVWKPAPELAVIRTAGETPVYTPYTNGQWINTDAGWYFKAPTPVEETVSHYGRWVNSPTAGWLWVPGRVWAPAWVDWKQNDTYVSWAPLPPSVYLVNGTMSTPLIDDNNYVIVDRKHFLDADIYKYNNLYSDNGNRILISEMTGTPGIIIVNNSIINRGPDVNIFQTLYGRNIELVKIQHIRNFDGVFYSDKEYNVYTPDFKRYKNKENARFTVNEPKSYKKYSDWKVKKSEEKEYKKEVKEYNKGEKEFKKVEKEIIKDNKNNNKGYKQNNAGNGNENEKVNKHNDNENKQNNNNKGTKNNDNGKKQNGNDKGKGKK
ncbi:MAG: hypothetical protein EHM58_17660 [Ignavibacteriae bacterium]|nr:MAG: hypothetical protein EHM58_17660 [Ignavibacteriota bacterium]